MKRLGRLGHLGWVAAVAVAANIGAWTSVTGCSGDDQTDGGDGGDAALDQTTDVNKADVVNETGSDVVTDVKVTDAGFDSSALSAFVTAALAAECNRFANCCYKSWLDAGTPDGAAAVCEPIAKQAGGFEYSLGPLNTPAVLNSGHVHINATAQASCLAGITSFSCPTIPGTEYATIAANCNEALYGDIPLGGSGCISSVECVPGTYCSAATDGGAGTCTALSGVGGPCNAGIGTGNEQCEYRGWVPAADGGGALRCSGNSTCQAKLGLDAGCANEWECQTNTCDDNSVCNTPSTAWTISYACGSYFPDAGFP